MLVLGLQLWRSFGLEAQLQQTEVERALLLGERILQRTVRSRDAFAAVSPTSRFVVRGGRIQVDEQVAWLHPIAAEVDQDAIVLDRLDRASHAEFVQHDQAAAQAEFDELLAGPLVFAQRLQVVSAALWQAKRAALPQRQQQLAMQLGEQLSRVTPAQLASPSICGAVVAAARLPAKDQIDLQLPPDHLERLLPLLPEVSFAGVDASADLTSKHETATQRRRLLVLAEQPLEQLGPTAPPGLSAITAEAVLWLLPLRDGMRDAAVLSPAQWFAALLTEARQGSTFEWPQRIEPAFGPADEVATASVPGIRSLRAVALPTLANAPWLLPALSALLACAFALAFVQQRRAARRESDAMAAQAQFLTTVTHELKTPLAGIRLLGEMLAEGRAIGKEHDYYRLLVGESARLSLLIDNVLDLGRLERGERSYTPSSQPLATVVRETLRMFAPVLEQHGLQVHFDDQLLGAYASIDRDAFVQALVAVLDNARKYGAAGKRLDVVATCAHDRLKLSVRDHGPGVPSNEQDSIFERFVRGRDHQHGSTPGVGIGLYLARSIVRRLGGDLTCISPASGDGAEFCFSLQRGEPQ